MPTNRTHTSEYHAGETWASRCWGGSKVSQPPTGGLARGSVAFFTTERELGGDATYSCHSARAGSLERSAEPPCAHRDWRELWVNRTAASAAEACPAPARGRGTKAGQGSGNRETARLGLALVPVPFPPNNVWMAWMSKAFSVVFRKLGNRVSVQTLGSGQSSEAALNSRSKRSISETLFPFSK